MAMGDGTHKLPVKAEVRRVIGKQGDTVTVRLEERLEERLGSGLAATTSGAGVPPLLLELRS